MSERGVSQEKVGDLLGINQVSVSRRLRGEVDFRLGELQLIANHFGVSLGSLVDEAVA